VARTGTGQSVFLVLIKDRDCLPHSRKNVLCVSLTDQLLMWLIVDHWHLPGELSSNACFNPLGMEVEILSYCETGKLLIGPSMCLMYSQKWKGNYIY